MRSYDLLMYWAATVLVTILVVSMLGVIDGHYSGIEPPKEQHQEHESHKEAARLKCDWNPLESVDGQEYQVYLDDALSWDPMHPENGYPMEGVLCVMFFDEAMLHEVGRAKTDVSGMAYFYLPPGTYWMARFHPEYRFKIPEIHIID